MSRTHLTHFKLTTIHMVNIGFEPLTFLFKIMRLKGSKIATHFGIQTSFAFESGNNRFGRIKVFLNLVELIHGVHLHATDSFGNFL